MICNFRHQLATTEAIQPKTKGNDKHHLVSLALGTGIIFLGFLYLMGKDAVK